MKKQHLFNHKPFKPITRLDGKPAVDIPSFVPQNMIAAPEGASHFKIVSAGAEVDFDNNTDRVQAKASDLLPWDATATTAISLENTLSPGSTLPLFLVLGIEFYQEVNGEEYPSEKWFVQSALYCESECGVVDSSFMESPAV